MIPSTTICHTQDKVTLSHEHSVYFISRYIVLLQDIRGSNCAVKQGSLEAHIHCFHLRMSDQPFTEVLKPSHNTQLLSSLQYTLCYTIYKQHIGCICLYFSISKAFLTTPLVESLRTTSDISNSFIGRGMFLLADIVFSNPGNSVVLATCKQTTRRVIRG